MSPVGHIKVNRFFCEVLSAKYEVIFVAGEKMIGDNNCEYQTVSIPEAFLHSRWKNQSRVVRVMKQVIALDYVFSHARRDDMILLLTYDLFSLWLFQFLFFWRARAKKVALLASNQVDKINRSIFQMWLWKRIPASWVHIVKERHMYDFLEKKTPTRNVKLVLRSINSVVKQNANNRNFSDLEALKSLGYRLIVSASKTSTDFEHLTVLVQSSKEQKVHFVVLAPPEWQLNLPNVTVFSDFLEEDDFGAILGLADVFWFPYKSDFVFRSSSLMFEVLNYKKPIVAREHLTFKFYMTRYNIGHLYASRDQFFHSLRRVSTDGEYCFDKILSDFSDERVAESINGVVKGIFHE